MPTKAQLTPAEVEMLLTIDAIKPAFVIWEYRPEDDFRSRKNPAPPVEQPAEVSSGVLLGDIEDVWNVPRLLECKVGAVLNLCPEWLEDEEDGPALLGRLQDAGICYKSLPAWDHRDFDIVGEVMPLACQFIEEQIQRGRRVLVNCFAGINRSGAVVVGFLALRMGMPLVAAIKAATRARGKVLTNRYFRLLLVRAALGTNPGHHRAIPATPDDLSVSTVLRKRGHPDVSEDDAI